MDDSKAFQVCLRGSMRSRAHVYKFLVISYLLLRGRETGEYEYPELQSVSPPYGGIVMPLSDVMLGGCSSYVTSECHCWAKFEEVAGFGLCEVS